MTFIFSFYGLTAQTYTNPIIPGSFPDPSICRVDDHYYIVNSSFEYFPALPIHKSDDLINWELTDVTFSEGAMLAREVYHCTVQIIDLPAKAPTRI